MANAPHGAVQLIAVRHLSKAAAALPGALGHDEVVLDSDETRDMVQIFRLVPETLELLTRNFPAPIRVLSCVGPARVGKSTLLNLVLLRSGQSAEGTRDDRSRFVVGGGSSAVTRGVWMWPHPLRCPDGQEGSVLLVDTEGLDLGDDQITRVVTAVACLASSRLLFFMPMGPSNRDLAFLSVMATLSNTAGAGAGIRLLPELLVAARGIDDAWRGATRRSMAADLGEEEAADLRRNFMRWVLRDVPGEEGHNIERLLLRETFGSTQFAPLPVCTRVDGMCIYEVTLPSTETPFGRDLNALLDDLLVNLASKDAFNQPLSGEGLAVLLQQALPAIVKGAAFPIDDMRRATFMRRWPSDRAAIEEQYDVDTMATFHSELRQYSDAEMMLECHYACAAAAMERLAEIGVMLGMSEAQLWGARKELEAILLGRLEGALEERREETESQVRDDNRFALEVQATLNAEYAREQGVEVAQLQAQIAAANQR